MKLHYAVVAAALTLAPAAGYAQEKLEFEVASIKPFSIGQPDGAVTLGARIDGAQVRMLGLTMRDLLGSAYRTKVYLINGPDWIATERYDINAKVPAGVSPDRLPDMLQSLLSERFGVKVHREKKEVPAYVLLIGKPPLKLREIVADPNATPPKAVEVTGTGSAAGLSVNMGNGSTYSLAGGKFSATKIDAPTIAAVLERFSDRPVVDLTALKGKYDFEFPVTPEDTQTMMIRAAVAAGVQLPPQALRLLDSGGNPIEAGAEQVGLKIESRRMPIEFLIVDQVQKTATDN
jgi:uncharacterized protein (TIGR03435 family)